ncbi:MAG: 50S ribosomal protein L10 [Candidatus Nealsonbacteria bacterium]
MPLTKEEKKQVIENLKEKIDKQKSIVFVSIENLKAKDFNELRSQLKENDCLLFVVKKTLLNLASKEKNLLIDTEKLKGEIALIFGFKDEISAAKISNNFSKKNEYLEILGGVFENKFIDKEKVIALAKIPSKEELLSKLVGSIASPISGFVNVLQGNIKGLINVLAKLKPNF